MQGGNTTRSMTDLMATAPKERFPTLRWLTAEAYPLKSVTFTDYRIKGWDSGQSDSLVLSQPLLELRCPSQTVMRSSEGLLHLKGDLVP
jgi:hypothetical protein